MRFVVLLLALAGPAAAQPVHVVLETSRGDIVLELEPGKAPKTVKNFLGYVRSGHYDGTVVYRIESFLIQMGSKTPDLRDKPVGEPIENEAKNGLKNIRGAVGMARWGPHTATAEYYVNLRDNPHLDHRDETEAGWGYCVFGRVVEGMDVVGEIARIPTEARGNLQRYPTEEVLIRRARVRGERGEGASEDR